MLFVIKQKSKLDTKKSLFAVWTNHCLSREKFAAGVKTIYVLIQEDRRGKIVRHALPHSSVRARICKRLRSPDIDSKVSILPALVAWRASTTTQLDVPVHPATYAGGIDSLESIPGLLKHLEIRAQASKKKFRNLKIALFRDEDLLNCNN
jgi:hypothetical protein